MDIPPAGKSQSGENMNWRNDGKAKETPKVDLYLKNKKLKKLLRMSLEELNKTRKERDGLKKGFIDLKASVQGILKSANDAERTIKIVETEELLMSVRGLEARTIRIEYEIQNLLTEFGMEEFEDVLESEPAPGNSASQMVASGCEEDTHEGDEFADFDFLPVDGPVYEQLPFQHAGDDDAELWKFEFLK